MNVEFKRKWREAIVVCF